MPGHRHIALQGFEAQAKGVAVAMMIRQGLAFWNYVAEPVPDAYLEICCALTRSAAPAAALRSLVPTRTLELGEVCTVPSGCKVPPNSPVSDVQLPWLFLFVRHFVDRLTE